MSPAPLFAVRTPTATVTDLGTEFGVEVDKQGITTSHVFRGSVRVQRVGEEGISVDDGQVLRENETARVDRRNGITETVALSTSSASGFIRELPKINLTNKIKIFDLVDVVAGGDGFSGKRHGLIHPVTGQVLAEHKPEYSSITGDGQYHSVPDLPFIDGVFIPDSAMGPTQVDSAGHRFSDFVTTRNITGGCVMAGGIIPLDSNYQRLDKVITEIDGVDYSSDDHGVLFMHANKGITFDLDAIRRTNPDCQVVRFLAMAGNTSSGLTDIWVLVDGQVRWRRREISLYNGGFQVSVRLDRADRFLTLVATDGHDDFFADWSMFGDPRLEMRLEITND